MADDVPILIFIEKLQKLQLLAEDGFLFAQLRKKVDEIVNELNQILTFLEQENASSKMSMDQLLPILYSAEYLVESLLLKTTRRRQKGVANKITKMPLFVFAPWSQLQLIYKMKEIKNSITAVIIKFEKFDNPIDPIPQGLELVKRHSNCVWHHYDETPNLPMIHRDTEEELVHRLIKDEEENLRAIALVSEESLGKTALAKKVYIRLDIRQHFQCRVWVHVGEDITYKDLLLIIIAQIPIGVVKNVELMNEEQLSDMLFQFFMKVKFLIVLDNVTRVDIWHKLVGLFADMAKRSRIVITTRKADVAQCGHGEEQQDHHHYSQVDPWSDPMCLKKLTEEESWDLFWNKVKVGTPEDNNDLDNLNSSRVQIMRICCGLPPAIVLLAGLLSTMGETDRSRVIGHLSQSIGEDVQSVPLSCILDLCYRKLPFVLRPCFLYLALFPKMFEIPIRRLLHLWLAEGFVQTSTKVTGVIPEDMAQFYLEELVRRNMIEIASRKPDGSPKTCFLPSFLHDVFLSKAKDVGFLHVHHCESDCTPRDSPNSNFVIRRLANQNWGGKSISESHTYNLCSYFSFETQKRSTSNNEIEKFLKRIMKRRSVSLLKVFDLESMYRPVLPHKMAEFQNLTYIGLRWTCLYSCPASIGHLPCLETLDLKYTNITTLPSSIWKAKKLRHLYMNEVSILKPSKEPSPHLQTLVGLKIGSNDPNGYGLNRLTSLRKLRLTCHETSVKNTVNCISELGNLQTVKLRSRDPFGQPLDIVLGNELKDHLSLLRLSLFGVIKDGIKDGIKVGIANLPRNLKTLTLSMSKLEATQMELLGELQQLNVLGLLARSYSGKRMEFCAGTFRELRVLKLWKLENLEQWCVKEGGLLKLEEMEIRDCGKLTSVDGLTHLPALKELLLTNMPPEFLRDDESCSDKIVRNEWKDASSQVCERTLLMKDLYDEVMRTEGFNEHTLASAFDHLVENEKAAKAFMVKSKELQRAWLETWRDSFDIVIEKKYFVDKESNKNCIVLFARKLYITHGDNPEYWRWITEKEASGEVIDVAELLKVWWLDIQGTIRTIDLSPGTMYEIVFVVKKMDIYSNFSFDLILKRPQHSDLLTHSASLEQMPSGKWIEILVDEFMMSPECVGIMEFTLRNHDVSYSKTGLAVKCAIIRPKK